MDTIGRMALVDGRANVTLLAKVYCFLIHSGLSKVFWADDTTMSTYLVNRSPSSVIGPKTPIDMLGGFVGLLVLSNECLNRLRSSAYSWDIVKVLQGVEFEVEPQEDHTFEVESHGNVDHVAGSHEVQTQDLMDYHSARDREQHSARELFGYREDSNEAAFAVARLKEDMDARSDMYVLSNGCKKSSDDSDGYYWEYTPGIRVGDCPRTEIRKIEEELYNLSVKENDLKPYVRRFQELTILCPNMVPNNEKLLEIFIGGLPRSMKKRYCLETSNFGGSHQHIPEVNGSDNKTRLCARNQ
ncbi:hypothetical protein Tco_1111140 [Tanacetum coccineum]|uniref:Reverse transcriptase domain-containing protein n=1 Tax=Tanacetum coccineum TaxID=301880 RepID=A0ABQ5IKS8_9ASTR